ncbi:MAG: cytochrome-c oxidase, cbb3-type subunit III [Aquabacterium sp.]
MSDFTSSAWSLFIGAATLVGLLACLVLLMIASRRKVMAADNTTGHVWDEDLREMNNPLPRWWMWLFIITVVFSLAYLVLYPGMGSYAGTWNWSSQGQWEAEQDEARKEMAPVYAVFAGKSPEQLAANPVAMGIGERLFLNNCAGCHGSDARGSKGFPNLTDSDWMWGGDPAQIAHSIAKGRMGAMPPLAAAVGSTQDVRNLANYVLSLSGSAHNNVAAELGRAKFGVCAACHGADGKGNAALGAPNLTDKVWLHGFGEDAIVAMVTQGKTGVMPAHEQRLSPQQLEVLTAWVWSRGGGVKPAAAALPAASTASR